MKLLGGIVIFCMLSCTLADYVLQSLNGLPLRSNFIDAHAECVRKGMILATPDTNEKNEVLREFITSHGLSDIWISANDIITEGQFQWMTTGQPVTNTDVWHEGEPNNASDAEDCVVLSHIHRMLLWNDRPCTAGHLVVCETTS